MIESISAKDKGACPVSHGRLEYAPFDHACAYESMARARREEPVFYSPEIDYWVVTRHEDVLSILRDPERFSASPTLAPVTPPPDSLREYLVEHDFTVEPVIVDRDPPQHTGVRQIAARFLNFKRYHAMEPQIRELVRERIAQLRGKGVVDLVDELTYELPARVLLLLFGVRDVPARRIKHWGDNRLAVNFGKPTAEQLEKAGEELADFFDFCKQLVADRLENPGDDFPSKLIELRQNDDNVMSLNQIASLVFGLMVAGHETTTNAAGNLILALLSSDRQQWERLIADRGLIPNAVEEGLRYNSSVFAWRRRAKQEVEVCGVTIPKDGKLLLALGSANHDERVFEDSESFDITRENAQKHIAFGNGIHFCLGAPLARLELRIIIEELLEAFPDMRLVPDQEIDWVRTVAFRGPTKLMVELGS